MSDHFTPGDIVVRTDGDEDQMKIGAIDRVTAVVMAQDEFGESNQALTLKMHGLPYDDDGNILDGWNGPNFRKIPSADPDFIKLVRGRQLEDA